MTSAAQQALRCIMEDYSKTTRFALACNLSNKIIEAIQSRCAVLRYSILNSEEVVFRITEIAEKEQVTITDDGLNALVYTADGDMRQAINNLQSTYSGFGIVNSDNVYKVCDSPQPVYVEYVIEHCSKTLFRKAVVGFDDLIWSKGYSTLDIINTFFFKVTKTLPENKLSEFLKLEYLKEIGFCHKRILEGCSSKLQLLGLLSRLCNISKETK